MREPVADTLAEYRRINVEGTKRLARASVKANAGRFVYLSSVKVNGESTTGRVPFTETAVPAPEDAYGISKWEAEQVLSTIAAETGLEVVVLRAPLVYGPGVRGNFLSLMNALRRGLPLPLASIDNRRSLVYLGNLVDAIVACIESPAAAGRTYLVSDGEDVSTPELIRRLAAALRVPARLLPCPPALLALGSRIAGRSDAWRRLGGSLQVDSSRIRAELGWQPRYSMQLGLEETARWYLNR